jgi:NAD(P)-dependent dehydrogenase (short-subunit alcohol dehydrogenase family)
VPTVLITGAGRGLGLEFARQYAADGWTVLACLRNPDGAADLRAVIAASGGRVEAHRLDVVDHGTIDALAAKLAGRPIDVLVNNAGTMGQADFATQGMAPSRFGQSNYANWETIFRVNTLAPMKMAEAFVEHVAGSEQKKIVALTSILGSMAENRLGGLYAYRASKAALNAIMRSLSIDLGRRYGIIVAPIHPGWVRTAMGGPRAEIPPEESVAGCCKVIAGLTKESSGRCWTYQGAELAW